MVYWHQCYLLPLSYTFRWNGFGLGYATHHVWGLEYLPLASHSDCSICLPLALPGDLYRRLCYLRYPRVLSGPKGLHWAPFRTGWQVTAHYFQCLNVLNSQTDKMCRTTSLDWSRHRYFGIQGSEPMYSSLLFALSEVWTYIHVPETKGARVFKDAPWFKTICWLHQFGHLNGLIEWEGDVTLHPRGGEYGITYHVF